MSAIQLGVNLSFAVKRWPEPEVWAAFVKRDLGLELVQFSFDLLDPWWPREFSQPLAKRIERSARAEGLTLHSAFVGLAAYTYNGLLHPEAEGRRAARRWFERAVDLTAEMGIPVIGGPVGGGSVEAAHASTGSRRYGEFLRDFGELSAYAKRAGLSEWLLEPTPLKRELPWSVSGAKQLLADLKDVSALPIRYALDVGHALYRPLYGPEASLEPWLALGEDIGLVHLQQTDGLSDSHWGFTRPGIVEVAALAAQLEGAGVHVPVLLEVFYPFEQGDEGVRRDIVATAQHCRQALHSREKKE